MIRRFGESSEPYWSSAGRSFVMRSLNPCPENFDQIVVVWCGGVVNYQMQIVTKLPNENVQSYQLQMIDSGGGGKLPNVNCDQTTKWKYPKLPTTNDRFGGGVTTKCKLWPSTKWYHRSGSEWLGTANFAQFTTFPIFSHRSGSEWLGVANFAWFATFPIFSY